jgi:hypothetical protein
MSRNPVNPYIRPYLRRIMVFLNRKKGILSLKFSTPKNAHCDLLRAYVRLSPGHPTEDGLWAAVQLYSHNLGQFLSKTEKKRSKYR